MQRPKLTATCAQAMPGDAAVQREVAARLGGGPTAPASSLAGLGRAALLEELRAAEARVAMVLQAVARSDN